MSGVGLKTPVSYLQEYFIPKKVVPKYHLIHNGIGTQNPGFIFRVEVNNISEDGVGRSKQEAKHRAAENMLRRLKIIGAEEAGWKSKESSEDIKDQTEKYEPVENYVGQLKEFCITHRYPEPTFDLEEMGGPPHSRTFKMVCSVSQLQDFGISRTKQQAKHQAAFKILNQLKALMTKNDLNETPEKTTHTTPNKVLVKASLTDEEIAEKFKALRSANGVEIRDPVAFYRDHHKAYVDFLELSPLLKKIVNNGVIDTTNVVSQVKEIAKELGVELQEIEIPTKGKDYNFIIMTMFLTPEIAAAGTSEEEAASKLMESIVILCK